MVEEHKVDDGVATSRKPTRDVWTTVTKTRRVDAESRRMRTVRIAIVRWRRPDCRVAERRFADPLQAEAFAKQRREELRTNTVRARGGTVPFSEWMDTYLSARCIEYVQWKRKEVIDAARAGGVGASREPLGLIEEASEARRRDRSPVAGLLGPQAWASTRGRRLLRCLGWGVVSSH